MDLVGLARSFGVAAERLGLSADWGGAGLERALRRALEARGPALLDVALDVPVRPLT